MGSCLGMWGEQTQLLRITQKATQSTAALARNGALFVPLYSTSHSLKTPAAMATILFTVVIMPKMRLRLWPDFSRRRAWNSVTIQLSNAL